MSSKDSDTKTKKKCPSCGGIPGLYPNNECPVCYAKRTLTTTAHVDSKDSELREELDNLWSIAFNYGSAKSVPNDTEAIIGEALQAINSRYITKEESDRRVLEGRIEEVKPFDLNMESVYASDPIDAVVYIKQMAEKRIAELGELLKGDKK